MNVFGRSARGWRKNRERGVSPIIATILLVAITVVLAAVLYVLVSGLTKTGASTPYSMGFAEQSASGSGTTWQVVLSISPTTGLTTGAVGLQVLNVNSVSQTPEAPPAACKAYITAYSTTCTGVSGGWYAVLVASNGTVAATYGTAGWSGFGSGVTTIALNSGDTMIVVSAVVYTGNGYSIQAYGTGTSSVSGSAIL